MRSRDLKWGQMLAISSSEAQCGFEATAQITNVERCLPYTQGDQTGSGGTFMPLEVLVTTSTNGLADYENRIR